MDATISSPPDVHGMTRSSGHELELGVAQRAHLGQVKPLELGLSTDPLPHKDVDEPVAEVCDGEDDAHQRAASDQLGHELPRIAVEQAGHRAIDPVPASAVVAGA